MLNDYKLKVPKIVFSAKDTLNPDQPTKETKIMAKTTTPAGKVRQLDGTTEGALKGHIRKLVKERRQALITVTMAEREIKKCGQELAKAEGLLVYPSLESLIRRFTD